MPKWILLALMLGSGLTSSGAAAEDTPAAPTVEATASATAVAPKASAAVKKTKSKGGKRTREKDADGTEAPNRFQADTVIKSQYKLNGQPLEVDPD